MDSYENASPSVHKLLPKRSYPTLEELSDEYIDDFDQQEMFELICSINDPEHPSLTLEHLGVVNKENIFINLLKKSVKVYFKPTIPHCSMATLIGLSILVMLQRSLPEVWKIDVLIQNGTHVSENEINKQLQDKERVQAAMENPRLRSLINNNINIDWEENKFNRPNLEEFSKLF